MSGCGFLLSFNGLPLMQLEARPMRLPTIESGVRQ